MKRRWKLIVGILLVLVIVAVSGFTIQKKKSKGVEVTVAKVERVDLASKVSANGKIEAQRKVDLSAHVMGQIVNLAVRKATWSRRATSSCRSTGRSSRRTPRAPRPRCARSSTSATPPGPPERRRRRTSSARRRTSTQSIIPQAELDRARAALDSARANVADRRAPHRAVAGHPRRSRDSLSKTTVHAPIRRHRHRPSGQGGRGHGHRHDEQPRHHPHDDLRHERGRGGHDGRRDRRPEVKVGQTANLTIDAYPNQTFDGTVVTEVGSSPMNAGLAATSEAVNFKVRIRSRIRLRTSARASRSPPRS